MAPWKAAAIAADAIGVTFFPTMVKGTMWRFRQGVAEYENSMEADALSHWKEALKIRKLPLLLRNLDFASEQANDLPQAIAYIEEITWDDYLNLDLRMFE